MPRRLVILVLLGQAFVARESAARSYFLERGDADVVIEGASLVGLLDFDGDGIEELLVDRGLGVAGIRTRASWTSPVSLDATPPDFTVVDAGASVHAVTTGDFDGDGRKDLLVAGRRFGQHALLGLVARPDWPSTWDLSTRPADFVISGGSSSVAVGDLDADGRDDLVVRHDQWPGSSFVVVRGRSTWPDVIDLLAGEGDAHVRGLSHGVETPTLRGPYVGDFLDDGWPDLAYVSSYFGNRAAHVTIVPGDGTWPQELAMEDIGWGTELFYDWTNDQSPGGPQLHVADVSGDGLDDLLVHYLPHAPTRVGFGSFELLTPGAEIATCDSTGPTRLLVPTDIDGDGTKDLIVASEVRSLRKRGGDSTDLMAWLAPLQPGRLDGCAEAPDLVVHGFSDVHSLISADVDRDGRLDVIVGRTRYESVGGAAARTGTLHVILAPDFAPEPAPADRFVDAISGDDTASGLDWTTAKRSIGAALADLDLTDGQVIVRIARGTYRENVRLGWDTHLIGGFDPITGLRDPTGTPSIVDGGGAGSCIEVLPAGPGGAPIIDGMVLTGGRAPRGAGVLAGGSVSLVNCIVFGNVATFEHSIGDASCPFSSPRPACRVVDTGPGAGIHVEGSHAHVEIVNTLVARNRGEIVAPDADCLAVPPLPAWCPTPELPPAAGLGSGLVLDGPERVTIRNVTVADNSGRGLVLGPPADCVSGVGLVAEVENTIFWRNGQANREPWLELDDVPGSLLGRSDIALTLRHCIVGSTAGSLDATNLRQDPAFVDPGSDYRLRQLEDGGSILSPAVDAGIAVGDPLPCAAPGSCMGRGSTRIDGATDDDPIDIGFHHFGAAAPAFDGATTVTPTAGCALLVSWEPAMALPWDGAFTYEVFRAASPAAIDTSAAPLALVAPPATSFVDHDAPHGRDSWYLVRVVSSTGASSASGIPIAGSPLDDENPIASLVAAAVPDACRVLLTLQAEDACSGIARVELHRSESWPFEPTPATLVALDPASRHEDVVPHSALWSYLLVATDAAGRTARSARLTLRAGDCAGPAPVPAEAELRVRKSGATLAITATGADGADVLRFYVGDVATLRTTGYSHAAGAGADGLAETSDDIGACASATSTIELTRDALPLQAYFLASGVNAAGEGLLGYDSLDRPIPGGADLGSLDCP